MDNTRHVRQDRKEKDPKANMLNTKSLRLQEQARLNHKVLDRDVREAQESTRGPLWTN